MPVIILNIIIRSLTKFHIVFCTFAVYADYKCITMVLFLVTVKETYKTPVMTKRIIYTLFTMLTCMVFVSCSDSDDFNPLKEASKVDFDPSAITFHKSSDNMETIEKWSDIVRDKNDKITGYSYTREVKGYINEKETRVCKIDYFTNHEGNEVIRTNTNVEFFKSSNGIDSQYTEKVLENISINKNGYIQSIETTTDHLDENSKEPIITTSERTFTYDGDLCTESTYRDSHILTKYKYKWNSYQLKKVTIVKENSKDNTVDYFTYDYTFDKKQFYKYSSDEILPFVQSGFPQIFASMGYIGKFTPYVLVGEVQGSKTDYGDGEGPRPKTEIRNTYSFDNENSQKLTYLGASNIYNAYNVTFSR